MTALGALQNLRESLCQRYPLGDQIQGRTVASRAAIAAFVFAARQIVTPIGIVGAANLGIDETVDGFGGKHRPPLFQP